jgi:L-amino acid N-acyltransferase YncA
MAVERDHRRRGIGTTLVEAAVERMRAQGRSTLLVATAAADVDNLRFYQHAGFRVRSVERDAFSPATGSAAGTRIDGIPLRIASGSTSGSTRRRRDPRGHSGAEQC